MSVPDTATAPATAAEATIEPVIETAMAKTLGIITVPVSVIVPTKD